MTLSKTQIIALRDAATKGKWHCYVGDEYADQFGIQRGEFTGIDSIGCDPCEQDLNDAAFVSALPDIAQTAIDALERVEVLEKEKLRERVDERISTLEKVQKLIIEHKASPELMDDVMGILKNPIGDWNPTV